MVKDHFIGTCEDIIKHIDIFVKSREGSALKFLTFKVKTMYNLRDTKVLAPVRNVSVMHALLTTRRLVATLRDEIKVLRALAINHGERNLQTDIKALFQSNLVNVRKMLVVLRRLRNFDSYKALNERHKARYEALIGEADKIRTMVIPW